MSSNTFTYSQLLITLVTINYASAFNFNLPYYVSTNLVKTTSTELYGGSWGKRKKEYGKAEFAKEGGARRGFDTYELQQQNDFMEKMKSDRSKLKRRTDEDFLAIAAMAGITDQNNDGVVPMGDFDEIENDDDFDSSLSDDNDLDLKVYFDDDDDDDNAENNDMNIDGNTKYDPESSITRLDGPSNVAGIGGEW